MLDSILRRPMTIEDFGQSLNIPEKEIEKHIKNLVEQGKIVKEVFGDKEFYKSTGKQL
jgi:predicted transcriptional regulator